MIWILILFAHAGPMSDTDSMALTSVSGFTSERACITAGKQAATMSSATTKIIKYTCVRPTE